MQLTLSRRPTVALLAAAALAGSLGTTASAALIGPPVTYAVSLDTAPLAADAADQPFALVLQLNSGGTPGVANMATFSRFAFAGGSPTPGTAVTSGDVAATSDLAGSVTMDTEGGALSYFSQDFTPGATLSFDVTTTRQGVDPTADTPDELAVQILDSAGNPIPTTAADATDALVELTYADTLQAATFGGDPSRTTTGGQTLAFGPPTATPVPEPTAACGLLAVAAAVRHLGRGHRRRLVG